MSRTWIRCISLSLLCLALPVLAWAQGQDPFSDLPKNHWAHEAVRSLIDRGVMRGYPDNSFRGNNLVTRYALAVTLAKAMEGFGTGAKAGASPVKVSVQDLETLQRLMREFADELSLLGVKTASFEERLRGLRSDMDRLSGRVDELEKGKGSKDSKDIFFENGSFRLVGYNKENLDGFSETVLNMGFRVEDEVSGHLGIRYLNTFDQQVGGATNTADELDTLEAYVDFKGLDFVDRLRAGRFYRKLGAGLVLYDRVEGFQLSTTRRDTYFELADFDALFFHLSSELMADTRGGFYHMRADKVAGSRPVWTGFYVEGKAGKKLDYAFELADYDSDGAGSGKAYLAEARWDLGGKRRARFAIGGQDESFRARSVDEDYAFRSQGQARMENVLQAIRDATVNYDPDDVPGFDLISLGYAFPVARGNWMISADWDILSSNYTPNDPSDFSVLTLAAEKELNDHASFQLRYQNLFFDNENAAATVNTIGDLPRRDNGVIRAQFFVKF